MFDKQSHDIDCTHFASPRKDLRPCLHELRLSSVLRPVPRGIGGNLAHGDSAGIVRSRRPPRAPVAISPTERNFLLIRREKRARRQYLARASRSAFRGCCGSRCKSLQQPETALVACWRNRRKPPNKMGISGQRSKRNPAAPSRFAAGFLLQSAQMPRVC